MKKIIIPLFIAAAMIPSISLAETFSMLGSWKGSPDCPIEFYRDDGNQVEGNCDNGSFNHIVRGRYVSPTRINITVTRIDPNQCSTSVQGYIQILNNNRVKFWQTGWNGCGVRTPPATQYWERISN